MDFSEFIILEAGEYPQWTFGTEIEVPFEPRSGGWDKNTINQIVASMSGLKWSWGLDQTCSPGVEIKHKPAPIVFSSLQSFASDLENFKSACQKAGLVIAKNPGRCATHFHIGGLSTDTKVKVAKIWINGGVQDLHRGMIDPARRELMNNPKSYMKRVDNINQYQSLPHNVAQSGAARFIQGVINRLKNALAFDAQVGWDKSYTMSPRGGLDTLEFRTKESSLDGRENVILIKSIAALCQAADSLYNQLTDKPLDSSLVRQAMRQGGVSGKDLSSVMRQAAGAS